MSIQPFRNLSRFLYILEGHKKSLVLLLAAILFTSLIEMVGIGLVGPFMSLATTPQAVTQNSVLDNLYVTLGFTNRSHFIAAVGLIIILLFYAKSALKFILQRYIFKFSYDRQGELRLKLLTAYLSLPYTYHLKSNTSLLIQNIINETLAFCNGVLVATLNCAVHAIVLLALLILLVITDPIATLVVFGVLIVVLAIYNQFKDKLSNWGKDMSQSQSEMIRIVNHSLGGLKETRVIGCESYFVDRMDEQAKRYAISMSSVLSFKIVPLTLVESLIITFLIGFASIILLLGQNTQQLTATLSVFAVASIRIIPTMNQFVRSISGIRSSSYAFDKLYYDLKELENLGLQENAKQLTRSLSNNTTNVEEEKPLLPFKDNITLDHVSYRYPETSELALQDISIEIKKGQSIAFIGKSGAGKTTLIDVILGLLTPESGDIRVDDRSIYQDIRAWQNLIGYIPQSIFLTDDTIERNIAFGVPDELIDSQRLDKAIKAAQLTNLIEQLPDGIKTQVGERGVRLSGGQRQRIGIARVLYHEREILVLDEATAALDNETEYLVTEAIKALSGTKTMIFIAHRLSTIEHCDCIYAIEKGRIVKSGSYGDVVLSDRV